jgi:AraC-like DNA-binding protein
MATSWGVVALMSVPAGACISSSCSGAMPLFTSNAEEGTAVLGNDLKEVQERIEEAVDFKTMVGIAENYLFKKVNQAKNGVQPIDQVFQHSQWHLQTLDQMAQAACLSSRQFERNFLSRIGVSPKFYSRLIRFNMAMKIKQKEPQCPVSAF